MGTPVHTPAESADLLLSVRGSLLKTQPAHPAHRPRLLHFPCYFFAQWSTHWRQNKGSGKRRKPDETLLARPPLCCSLLAHPSRRRRCAYVRAGPASWLLSFAIVDGPLFAFISVCNNCVAHRFALAAEPPSEAPGSKKVGRGSPFAKVLMRPFSPLSRVQLTFARGRPGPSPVLHEGGLFHAHTRNYLSLSFCVSLYSFFPSFLARAPVCRGRRAVGVPWQRAPLWHCLRIRCARGDRCRTRIDTR